MRKDIEITTKEAEKGDLGQNHIFEMNAHIHFLEETLFSSSFSDSNSLKFSVGKWLTKRVCCVVTFIEDGMHSWILKSSF